MHIAARRYPWLLPMDRRSCTLKLVGSTSSRYASQTQHKEWDCSLRRLSTRKMLCVNT